MTETRASLRVVTAPTPDPAAPPLAAAAAALSDDELMLLAQAGRTDAFALLMRRHQKLVLGLAVRCLGDAAAGRDVAQDVFLSLWTDRARYEPRGKLRAYLVSMTLNRCRHTARSGARTHTSKDAELRRLTSEATSPPGEEGLPLTQVLAKERARRVREELTRVPEACREVLVLRFTHGLALEEIASITGAPLGTVKSHVSRGLRRLQQLLGGERP